jgi:multidrug resistance efflux pump
MKAKLIRQGAFDTSYFSKEAVKPEIIVSDPSLKKMKEEIQSKESKNQELNDELKRMRQLIQDNVGDNEMNKDLLNELKIKEDLMNHRDSEINGLVSDKQQMENQKEELMTMIDQLKKDKLSDRKKILIIKRKNSEGDPKPAVGASNEEV